MKKFFKKIAFVSAMAMVVSNMPAQSAAAAEGPQMYSTLKFYLGGDATGSFDDEARYARVWNWKDEFDSVSFKSDNETVATVTKKGGKVTPISVGTANVTATFTTDDGDEVEKVCKVTVKQNAADIKISDASAEALLNLTVGDKFTVKTCRTTVDGVDSWKGKDVITDSARFTSSKTDVFTVTKKGGTVKAVAAGEATLSVWAVQSEGPTRDENNKVVEYKPTTATKEYKVVVKNAAMTSQQTAYNAFEITFPTEAEAKAAVDKTTPSLNTSDAAVTEAEDIIKVYKVIKNAAKEKVGEVAVFISGVSQKSDNKAVVNVSLFDELEQETDYVIRYKDQEVVVTTIKNVAASFDIVVADHEKLGEDASKSVIGYKLYAVGPNGQSVDITGCKDYAGWTSSVVLEDTNVNQYHAEYVFDAAAETVWFYTADTKYAVTLKATFEDWVNLGSDNKAKTFTAVKTINPGDNSILVGNILDWGVIKNGSKTHSDWDAYNTKAFAADDLGYQLIVKAFYYDAAAGKNIEVYSEADGVDDHFTFVSSNDDKLVVDKSTGELYPPKTAVNGTVGVLVFYDDKYIGTCDVQVYTKRALTGFTAELSDTKLDFNSDSAKDVNDTITLTLKPVDQLGAVYNTNMDFTAEVYASDTVKSYINIVNAGADDNGNPKYSITATDNLPADKITSFRIICTATSYDDNGEKNKELKYSVSLSAKNTVNSIVKSYDLEASTNSVDMIINTSWPNDVDAKKVTFKAYSYDKDGFKVEHLSLAAVNDTKDLATAKDVANLVVQLGKDYVPVEQLVVSGKDLQFAPVTVANDVKVASGSSEFTTLDRVIKKAATGNYAAYLYVGNGSKAVFKSSELVTVKDTQPTMTWNWAKYSTDINIADANDIDSVIAAIQDTIKFNKYNDKDYTAEIYVGYEAEEGDAAPSFDDDFTIKGNRLTIKQVRCIVTLKDWRSWVADAEREYNYEMVIPVMRTINFGVTE